MSIVEAIWLALIQGITEFLPISSSAHLILPSQILGWADQGLAFDVAVHVGTLLAVVMYYRQDVGQLAVGWVGSMTGRHSEFGRLAWLIVLATIPAGLAGLFGSSLVENYGRSALIIAITTIVFGLVLWYADVRASEKSGIESLTIRQALLVGVAQAIALIPGTSRSGITMTAGLLLGLKRLDAARFSFLVDTRNCNGGWLSSCQINSVRRCGKLDCHCSRSGCFFSRGIYLYSFVFESD